MIEHNQIFVDGQWRDSAGNERLDVINPATEEKIARVPRGTPHDVDLAAKAAARAFGEWSRSSVQERADIFRTLARLTQHRCEEITRTIVSEVGQPITLAAVSQTAGAVDELLVIADCIEQIAWSVTPLCVASHPGSLEPSRRGTRRCARSFQKPVRPWRPAVPWY
jgi:acyl-CoA reductase-like NAD-dependent aldehyde dehydrogenase